MCSLGMPPWAIGRVCHPQLQRWTLLWLPQEQKQPVTHQLPQLLPPLLLKLLPVLRLCCLALVL